MTNSLKITCNHLYAVYLMAMPDTFSLESITKEPLIDSLGRQISYLRLSVTDRCDFRCQYCMAEKMTFLPKKDVLSLEELYLIAKTFMACGIDKIRLTGGEPLVRRDIQTLISLLGNHVSKGDLKELTMTTNGSQLGQYASMLAQSNVKRLNVSLDSLNPDKFKHITRRGSLKNVLKGIDTAVAQDIHIKINMVIMGQENMDDLLPMVDYCTQNKFDLTLIEAMPLEAGGIDRAANFMPLSACVDLIQQQYALLPSTHSTAGPARYMTIDGSQSRLGLITPLTQNFCQGCNRIRLTCTGKLYPCLGHDTHLDFRELIRSGAKEVELVQQLRAIIAQKPAAHDFEISSSKTKSATTRSMNTTGG
ncbi:GTP 3',8-cyclase MoaA [Temperatibacter marinus]|uniref:GTP 3',8-cyclase n=1 Tax=Temperatibacter marinus TaxID=1456591 RepID=A0AA52EHN1_9PROT|nr:GTP 3',8-cyclase MoaA [Temperatibacter marinus]WND02489.1 GTP 3',8-cyclase MoaA [Temperatibacter marinus]